jgi:hypothetical protein
MPLRSIARHCDVCGILTPYLKIGWARFVVCCDEFEADACIYRAGLRHRAAFGDNGGNFNAAAFYFSARESRSLVSWTGPLVNDDAA